MPANSFKPYQKSDYFNNFLEEEEVVTPQDSTPAPTDGTPPPVEPLATTHGQAVVGTYVPARDLPPDPNSNFQRGLETGFHQTKALLGGGLRGWLGSMLGNTEHGEIGAPLAAALKEDGSIDPVALAATHLLTPSFVYSDTAQEGAQKTAKRWVSEGIEYYSQEMAKAEQFAGDVPTVEDISSLADFGAWSAHALGTLAPDLLGMFGTGAIAKKGVEEAARKSVEKLSQKYVKQGRNELIEQGVKKETADKIANDVAGQFVDAKLKQLGRRGMGAGMFTYGSALGTASTFPRILEETGVEAPWTSLGSGTIQGALNLLPSMTALKKFLPKNKLDEVQEFISGQVLNKGKWAKQFLKDVFTIGGLEMTTEALQFIVEEETISWVNNNFTENQKREYFDYLTNERKRSGLINNAAVGFLAGNTMGFGGATYKKLTGRYDSEAAGDSAKVVEGKVVEDTVITGILGHFNKYRTDRIQKFIRNEFEMRGLIAQGVPARVPDPVNDRPIDPMTGALAVAWDENGALNPETNAPYRLEDLDVPVGDIQFDGLPPEKIPSRYVHRADAASPVNVAGSNQAPTQQPAVTEQVTEQPAHKPVGTNKDETTVYYHGSNKDFDAFDTSAERVNNTMNVRGVYLYGEARKGSAKNFGENTYTVISKKGLKTFNRQGENKLSPEMIEQHKIELENAGYGRGGQEELDEYATSFEKWSNIDGEAKARVLKAGGYEKYIDGDEIVILDANNVKIIDKNGNPVGNKVQPESPEGRLKSTLQDDIVDDFPFAPSFGIRQVPEGNREYGNDHRWDADLSEASKPVQDQLVELSVAANTAEAQDPNNTDVVVEAVDQDDLERVFDRNETLKIGTDSKPNGKSMPTIEEAYGDKATDATTTVAGVMVDMSAQGVPHKFIDAVTGVYVHTDKDVDAPALTGKGSQGISVNTKLVDGAMTEQDQLSELAWTMTHEVYHAADYAYGLSDKDDRFGITIEEDADQPSVVMGDIMEEIYDNWESGTPLGKRFDYPFNDLKHDIIDLEQDNQSLNDTYREEVFAQLGALFHSNPKQLQEFAPQAYNFIKGIRDNNLQTVQAEVQDEPSSSISPENTSQPTGISGQVRAPPEPRSVEVVQPEPVRSDGEGSATEGRADTPMEGSKQDKSGERERSEVQESVVSEEPRTEVTLKPHSKKPRFKKAENYEDTGEYIVSFPDGDRYRVYYDDYAAEAGDPTELESLDGKVEYLGETKNDALESIMEHRAILIEAGEKSYNTPLDPVVSKDTVTDAWSFIADKEGATEKELRKKFKRLEDNQFENLKEQLLDPEVEAEDLVVMNDGKFIQQDILNEIEQEQEAKLVEQELGQIEDDSDIYDLTDDDLSDLDDMGFIKNESKSLIEQADRLLEVDPSYNQAKVRSLSKLQDRIPLDERIAGEYTQGEPLAPISGGRFSDLNLSNLGAGMSMSQAELDAILDQAITLTDTDAKGRVGNLARQTVERLGVNANTAPFWDGALRLSDNARYWYEVSAEGMRDVLPDLSDAEIKQFISVVAATSPVANPYVNMHRTVASYANYLQGKPIDNDLVIQKSVTDALKTSDLEGLKTGSFGGTMQLVLGLAKPTLSTNDRQVATTFNTDGESIGKNPELYEVMSRFYIGLRDKLNATLPEGAQPYETWQLQALGWVEQRFKNEFVNAKIAEGMTEAAALRSYESASPEEVSGGLNDVDDYSMSLLRRDDSGRRDRKGAIQVLEEAGINVPQDKITRDILLNPKVPAALSPTTASFREKRIISAEINTLRNEVGEKARAVFDAAIAQDNQKVADEYHAIFATLLNKASQGEANPFTAYFKALGLSKVEAKPTRVATPTGGTPFAVGGSYQGDVSPNIRVPVPVSVTAEQLNVLMTSLAKQWDQDAIPASHIMDMAEGLRGGYTETSQVFVETLDALSREQVEAFANALPKGSDINYTRYPNGYEFNVIAFDQGGNPVTPDMNEVALSAEAMQDKTGGSIIDFHVKDAQWQSAGYSTIENYNEVFASFKESLYNKKARQLIGKVQRKHNGKLRDLTKKQIVAELKRKNKSENLSRQGNARIQRAHGSIKQLLSDFKQAEGIAKSLAKTRDTKLKLFTEKNAKKLGVDTPSFIKKKQNQESLSTKEDYTPQYARDWAIDIWGKETGLSPREIDALAETGDYQRGDPEVLMVEAQQALGSGVKSFVLEHLGDLVNRMSAMHSVEFAVDESLDKIDKVLRTLEHPYGHDKEAGENLVDSASFFKVPLEEYRAKADKAVARYTEAHKSIPVYTEVHAMANEATIAYGEGNTQKSIELLKDLRERIDTEDKFKQEVSRIDLNMKTFAQREDSLKAHSPKEDYELSQLSAKKFKRYGSRHPLRELRREIAAKREKRRLLSLQKRDPLSDSVSFRLDDKRRKVKYQEQKIKDQEWKARILDNPNTKFWTKTDLALINRELDYGREYSNHALRIEKANLKGLVGALKKTGWEVAYTSKHNNLVSSYYMTKDGVEVRVSDHELPNTPMREHNRSQGFGGTWSHEVIVSNRTSIAEQLAEIAQFTIIDADTPSFIKKKQNNAKNNTLDDGSPSTFQFTFNDEIDSQLTLFKRLTSERNIKSKKLFKSIADRYATLQDFEDQAAEHLGVGRLPAALSPRDQENLSHGRIQKDIDEFHQNYVDPIGDLMADLGYELDAVETYLIAKHAEERNDAIAEKVKAQREKNILREERAIERLLEDVGSDHSVAIATHTNKINQYKNDPLEFQDTGSGMTYDEAKAILDLAEQEGTKKDLELIASKVYEMHDWARQRMVEAGLLDKVTKEDWEERFKYYVPLKGFAAELNMNGNKYVRGAKSRGFSIIGRESMKAKGRSTLPYSPLIQSFEDIQKKIVRARKNEYAQVLLDLLSELGLSDSYTIYNNNFRPMKDDDHLTMLTLDEMRSKMRKDNNAPKYVEVKKGGQTFMVEFESAPLNDALQNMSVPMLNHANDSMGNYIRGLTRFQTFRRNMLINYNPSWGIVNPLRDIQTGLIYALGEMDKVGSRVQGENILKKMTTDYPIAVRTLYRHYRGKDVAEKVGEEWAQYMREYVEDGAPTGLMLIRDSDEEMRILKRKIKRGGLTKETLKLMGKWVEDANITMENSIRLTAYVNARRVGTPREDAATLAKDLTVNFNRKGEDTAVFNAHFLFFNAAVQGDVNIVQTLGHGKQNEGKTGAQRKRERIAQAATGARKVAGALVAFNAMIAAMNILFSDDDDDDEITYADIPEHAKNRALLFKGGADEGFALQLPYGYNFFANIGRLSAEMAFGVNTPEESAYYLWENFMLNFVPVHHSSGDTWEQQLRGVYPDIMEVHLDLMANKNFFGSDIYLEQNPLFVQKSKAHMARRSTDQIYKSTAQFLNDATGGDKYEDGWLSISPDKTAYIMEYFLGGVGRFLTQSADVVGKMMTDEEVRMQDLPAVGVFFENASDYKDRFEFYDSVQYVQQVEYRIKDSAGDPKELERIVNEYAPFLPFLSTTVGGGGFQTFIRKELNTIGQARKRIEDTAVPLMLEEQKRQNLEKLLKRENRLFDDYNKMFRKAMKKM